MSDHKELIQLGKKHFEGKNYVRAQHCFQKVLRTGARYADVLNMMGVIHHMEGKFNDALSSFQEALKLNPQYTEANLNLAVLLNDLGDYKKAKEIYSQVRKKKVPAKLDSILKGKITNLHAELGDLYKAVGFYDAAIGEYEKALKISPTYIDICTKLGVCYRDNNQKELSIRTLKQAVSNYPNYRYAHIQLGMSYFSAGQKPKAVQVWKDVLKKDPTNEMVTMYLRLCENGTKSSSVKSTKKSS